MAYYFPKTDETFRTLKAFTTEKNISLPKGVSTETLESLGLHEIVIPERPVSETKRYELSGTIWDGETASKTWIEHDLTEQEMLERVPWQSLADAQFELATWINKLTYQVDGKYPMIIKEGWDEEEAMAVAFMTETETPEQLAKLQTLAATKGRTVVQHVELVLYLAGSFHKIKDVVHELWLSTDGALENAASPLEYQAIFDVAKATAKPLAAAYGLVLDD